MAEWRTSPMWLIFLPTSFFLLPAVSSTSSCPSKLPCNSSIEIRPPFFVGTPGLDPACRKSINVSCGVLGPELNLVTNSKLLLKDISYDSCTVTVQDLDLSVLKSLPCKLTLFTFIPPVFNFQSSYLNLERRFSSIQCNDSNPKLFRSMFGEDKDVSSVEPDDRTSARCSPPPLFQWILHFGELNSSAQLHQANFSVVSVSINKDVLSSTNCSSSSAGDLRL